MTWRPPVWTAIAGAVAALGLVLGVEGTLAQALAAGPVGPTTFFLGLALVGGLLALLLLAGWLYSLLVLRYTLDRQALVIHTATARHCLPLGAIGQVLPGEALLPSPGWSRFLARRVIGPGGALRPTLGVPVVCAAPRFAAGQLAVVRTPSRAFVLALPDREALVRELAARGGGAAEGVQEAESLPTPWAALPFWRDRPAHLLVLAAALGNALLFAYTCFRFPALPAFLPLHYNALGEADYIGPRAEVFGLPALGALALGANLLLALAFHRRERMAAYLLLAAALFLQPLILIALLKLA